MLARIRTHEEAHASDMLTVLLSERVVALFRGMRRVGKDSERTEELASAVAIGVLPVAKREQCEGSRHGAGELLVSRVYFTVLFFFIVKALFVIPFLIITVTYYFPRLTIGDLGTNFT